MKALFIEVHDELARRLERVAPIGSRRWTEFVRAAILKALWEAEEQATAEAYARHPDCPDATCDPAAWEGREAANPIDILYGCLKDLPRDPLTELEAEHRAEIEADKPSSPGR